MALPGRISTSCIPLQSAASNQLVRYNYKTCSAKRSVSCERPDLAGAPVVKGCGNNMQVLRLRNLISCSPMCLLDSAGFYSSFMV